MKPPKRITCDGQTIRVVTDQRLGRFERGYGRGGDYKKNVARLSKGLTRKGEKVTLLHELMHHVWERASLREFLSSSTEELVLDSISGWLLILLQENPELVEYLTERTDNAT